MYRLLLTFNLFVLKESQSNHSSQTDSGMSDGTSSSHARSQSVVSSIFSEAWKRGTQIEESTKVSCLLSLERYILSVLERCISTLYLPLSSINILIKHSRVR